MRSDKPGIGKGRCRCGMLSLNREKNSTRYAYARFAGSSAKRSGSRNYRGQFRQIAISNPVHEQRFVVHGASPVATLVCFGRRSSLPAILTGAKWRARRCHDKGCNRQQTQRLHRPSRNSNSHRPQHPFITLRRQSACVNLTVPLRTEKTMLHSPYPCESLPTTTLPAKER
jgi:hypothetical protein